MQLRQVSKVIELDKQRKEYAHDLRTLQHCRQLKIHAEIEVGPNISDRPSMCPQKGEELFESAVTVMKDILVQRIEEIEEELKEL